MLFRLTLGFKELTAEELSGLEYAESNPHYQGQIQTCGHPGQANGFEPLQTDIL